MRVYILLAILLWTGLKTAPQEGTRQFSIPLSDLSAPGSPLMASGEASFRVVKSLDRIDAHCTLYGELRNASSKTIIAFEASLDLIPGRAGCVHYDYQIDYAFDRDLLGPSSQYSLSQDISTWEEVRPRGEYAPDPPKAELTVKFVEFADGSKFGDSHWGDDLPNQRKKEIERMSQLLRAYETGDHFALSKAVADGLAQQDKPRYMDVLLREIQDCINADGPDAAAEEIRFWLANARGRIPTN